MHRYIRLLIVVILVCVTSACAKGRLESAFLGKSPPGPPQSLDSEVGEHRWVMNYHVITYTYRLKPEDATITFTGQIEYYRSIEDSKYKHETVLLKYENLSLTFLFVDRNFEVVAVEVEKVPKSYGKRMVDTLPFSIVLPYSEEYERVFTSYSFSALGT